MYVFLIAWKDTFLGPCIFIVFEFDDHVRAMFGRSNLPLLSLILQANAIGQRDMSIMYLLFSMLGQFLNNIRAIFGLA